MSKKMGRKGIRVVAVALSTLIVGTGLASCRPPLEEGEIQIDETKTQLSVANYDGGVGSEWFTKVNEEFEKKYANEEFEPGTGKKGVQIVPDVGKADHISQISTDAYNVIFAESVDVNSLIASNSILEITDIVQAVGEDGKTIESKMSESQRDMLSAAGGYYALPHYEYYPGITYDKKVFNDKSLYISASGGYTNADGDLSAGPDGKPETLDDGLPATIEEFIALCRYMRDEESVAPFIYSMQMPGYTDVIPEALTLSLQDTDSFMLNFTFDSTKGGKLSGDDLITTNVITGWNGDTPTVEVKTVTSETGYLTTQQVEKYYALKFLETIADDTDTFISAEVNSSTDNLGAQRKYVFSALNNVEPAAMLIEGSFWYNEAKTSKALSDSVAQKGNRAKNRDFAWMPLPTAVSGTVDETNGRPMRLVDEANSYAVINANIRNNPVKVGLAKLYLQYCYTDANLELFTEKTGCWKALNYDIGKGTYDGLDKFYQSIADARRAGEVVRPLSSNPIFVNNQYSFMYMRSYYFKHSGAANAFTVFKNGSYSAKSFIEGMKYSDTDWADAYGAYYQGN